MRREDADMAAKPRATQSPPAIPLPVAVYVSTDGNVVQTRVLLQRQVADRAKEQDCSHAHGGCLRRGILSKHGHSNRLDKVAGRKLPVTLNGSLRKIMKQKSRARPSGTTFVTNRHKEVGVRVPSDGVQQLSN